jgi:hypothetical protein
MRRFEQGQRRFDLDAVERRRCCAEARGAVRCAARPPLPAQLGRDAPRVAADGLGHPPLAHARRQAAARPRVEGDARRRRRRGWTSARADAPSDADREVPHEVRRVRELEVVILVGRLDARERPLRRRC